MKTSSRSLFFRICVVGIASILNAGAVADEQSIQQKKSSELLRDAITTDSPIQRRLIERELFSRARDQMSADRAASVNNSAVRPLSLPSDGSKPEAGGSDTGKNDVSPQQLEAALVGAGFGFTTGYGYYFRSQQSGVTAKVTYNFYKLYTKETSVGAVPEADSPWFGSKLTSVCGWIGTATGKVSNRDGTAKETPLVFGLSGGIGHISGRSSAVFFDLGGAVFSNRSFSRIEPYGGVSVDLEVFKTLLSKITDSSGK